jgi:hypothetical protein
MADNTYGGTGEQRPKAADEVAGVLYPRVKVVWGADNTCTDTSAAAPLPVVPSALVASTAIVGDVGLAARATTTNALSGLHRVATADTNAVNVKASAGRFYGLSFYNASAAAKYVKLHNTAGTPTAGTGVIRTFGIAPNASRDVFLPIGHFFATGIGMSITGAAADADTTALQAGDVVGEVWFA